MGPILWRFSSDLIYIYIFIRMWSVWCAVRQTTFSAASGCQTAGNVSFRMARRHAHPFRTFPRYRRTMTFILHTHTHTLLTALCSRCRVPIPTSCFSFTEQSARTCYHRPWCWLCWNCWIVSWSWTRALVSRLGWHVYPESVVGEFHLDIQKRRINFFFLSLFL